MTTVWLVEHLPDIWLREDDSSYPPLEKVEPKQVLEKGKTKKSFRKR
jgi:hypothetical protein